MNIRQSLAWTYSQQFIVFGLQFIGSVVIARLLTPTEIGIFSIAMAASYFIIAMRDFGVTTYLIREEKLTELKIRTAFGILLAISWSLGIILLLSSTFLAAFYEIPDLIQVIGLLSITFFITPFGQPAQALLTRDMRFDVLHHINLFCSLTGLVINITLAYLGFSFMALAWGHVISTVLRSILLISIEPKHLKMLPSFHHWRSVLNFGGLMSITSIMGTVNTEGMKFALASLISPAGLAFFERAVQLPNLARQTLLKPLRVVLTPAYAKSIRNGESIVEPYIKVTSYSAVLIWPIFLTIALIPQSIIVTIFGENWRVAGEILPYFLLSNSVFLITNSSQQLIVAYGKVKLLAAAATILSIVSLSSAIITLHYSLETFAASRVYVAAFQVILFGWSVHFVSGIGVKQIVPTLWKPALVSVIGSMPAILYRLHNPDNASIETIILIAFCSVPSWFLGVLLTRHSILAEIKLLALKIKRPARQN